jgi:hypothetical protein
MRNKDTILLEQAYNVINEFRYVDYFEELVDQLVSLNFSKDGHSPTGYPIFAGEKALEYKDKIVKILKNSPIVKEED